MLITLDTNVREILDFAEPITLAEDFYDGTGLECYRAEEYYHYIDSYTDGTLGGVVESLKTIPNETVSWFLAEGITHEAISELYIPEALAAQIEVLLSDPPSVVKLGAVFPDGLPHFAKVALYDYVAPNVIVEHRKNPDIAKLIREF